MATNGGLKALPIFSNDIIKYYFTLINKIEPPLNYLLREFGY